MVSHEIVKDSEFNMWRAVFAFSMVDNMLSLEEQEILNSHLKTVPFSPEQLMTLKKELRDPQDVEKLYKGITKTEDKKRFCVLARALAWCEGDMDRQEEKILKHVGCIKGSPDEEMMHDTRNHPNLNDFYQHYSKAGMVGLMKYSPSVQMSA